MRPASAAPAKTYLYADDVFYSPRPDLGGYEVVNDPEDEAPEQPQAPPEVLSAAAQPPAESPGRAEDVAAPVPAPASAPALPSAAVVPSNPTGIAILPRNGQSEDQQALDRYACYRFAVTDTGFDPVAMASVTPPDQMERRDSDYSRAQAACLEARGYSLP